MHIHIKGARENNLKDLDVEFFDGLTVVTGISGSGKSSLVFSCLYHEARRRFLDVFARQSSARLAPAHVQEITGLGPTVAIEQNVLNSNPLSTLASASGLHPFLRLLYTNFGERRCYNCGSKVLIFTEDMIIAQLMNYCKIGSLQIYAPIMQHVKGSHTTLLGFLKEEFGAESILINGKIWQNPNKKLNPLKEHSIEIKISSIDDSTPVTKVREYVRQVALLGSNAIKIHLSDKEVITFSLTNVCSLCGTWLSEIKPLYFHTSCSKCNGEGCVNCDSTGLHPEAAAIYWKGLRITELLELSVTDVVSLFQDHELPSHANRLVYEIKKRLDALMTVGIGYLTLNRSSPSLSRGESQRVRLAVALTSRLEDMLHVLDEPTIGLSINDTLKLLPAFNKLAGPVIYVEHDRVAAAAADHVLDLGPGAGIYGGEVVFDGTPAQLWEGETLTGRYFSMRERVLIPEHRPNPDNFISIKSTHLRNLQNIDIFIPFNRLTLVTGPSGSGKSTLVEDVLYTSISGRETKGCKEITGISKSLKAIIVDQKPIGKNPRSNPATYTKLAAIIRDIFAELTDLTKSHFSFNRSEGACSECKGMGAVEIKMRYLPSTWIPCHKCMTKRFSAEVLTAKVRLGKKSYSIADIYDLTVDEIIQLIPKFPKKTQSSAKRVLSALNEVGLGYLKLGQPSPTLSGGEAQRVKLAKYLGMKSLEDRLLILDEPSTGLSPYDIIKLFSVLDNLVRSGATIIVVEHNSDFIRAADWIIYLGPGAGPDGGHLIYCGPSKEFEKVVNSVTVKGLLNEESIRPRTEVSIPKSEKQNNISIRNASIHNLKNVTCDFPKEKITVVTGVSGSGKSSLVSDVLRSEAERRFLETLSLYERQGIREGPETEVEEVTGLGVALNVAPRKFGGWYNYRSTVGLITEISNHLAVLFSQFGKYECLNCGNIVHQKDRSWYCPDCQISVEVPDPLFFSSSNYASACTHCHGVGTIQIPQSEKLIVNPEKPLCQGAMHSPGFFPKGYLCKPFNGGYYFVQAIAKRYKFDPMTTPWNNMTSEAQQAFLFGDPEPIEVTFESRKQGTYTRTVTYPGFYGWIRDWDVGGTYTKTEHCPKCGGARLRPQYLAVKLSSFNVHELNEIPLNDLYQLLIKLSEELIDSHSVRNYSFRKIIQRLKFLIDVGLGYIHLSRLIWSLSAGEAQRIRLASLLGSGLTSLTILIDEPTRGLHPSEVEQLIFTLKHLRDEGNTVILVEHDLQVISSADNIVDMGPGSGVLGGEIIAEGTPKEFTKKNTITAKWLGKKQTFNKPQTNRKPHGWIKLIGATENNLKGDPCEIPLGVLVGICGVSGSGKSTLIIDTLARIIVPRKQTTSVAYEPIDPGRYESIVGSIPNAMIIDQSRKQVYSPLNFFGLKKTFISIFASSNDAMQLGLDAKQLSKPCSSCKGRGLNKIDMTFLPDVYTSCETCNGSGLATEVMDVRIHGYTLPQLYQLTLNQIYTIFKENDKISRVIRAAKDVGLGYLVLNQPGFTLSGGECQRMKIAKELSRKRSGKKALIYILDEPTIGQHLEDIKRLIGVLNTLVDAGNTVIVIEHHPHVLASCDWLIELGPTGGSNGGYIIGSGTPKDIIKVNTPTAPYISPILEEFT
jgi:excinuclease ABC subunit A